MLSQNDIDTLMRTIQFGEHAYVYYVAHMIEGRETDVLDEHSYKDISKFKVVKVEVEDIQNAYFEYLNYLYKPDDYHIEEEEYYYDPSARYIKHFVVPNAESVYSKDINARMPSIIYGYTKKIYIGNKLVSIFDSKLESGMYDNYGTKLDNSNILRCTQPIVLNNTKSLTIKSEPNLEGLFKILYFNGDTLIKTIKNANVNIGINQVPEAATHFLFCFEKNSSCNDYNIKIYADNEQIKEVKYLSPIKPVYTNNLEFGNMSAFEVDEARKAGKLLWKYRLLSPPADIDGILYKYITSNWYILTLKNYPMIEKPLINTNQYSCYFMDIQDAFRYMEQLIA